MSDEPTTILNASKDKDKIDESAKEKDKNSSNVTMCKNNNGENDVISNNVDNLSNKNPNSKNEQVK